MKTVIVGGGNIGAMFARAFVMSGQIKASELTVIEVDGVKRRELQEKLGVRTLELVDEWDGGSEILLLAVKPQDARTICKSLVGMLSENTLVISMMAGIKLENLHEMCGGHRLLIRVMPNLPAKVGEGVSVFVSAKGVSEERIKMVESLLGVTGYSLRVEDEMLLDSATAISGSGPGYVFYLLEHFIRRAMELGFSEVQAGMIVKQTLVGAIRLWEESGEPVEDLRKRVTSKGGTTEAAIQVFEDLQLGDAFEKGIQAAFQRSRELSQ